MARWRKDYRRKGRTSRGRLASPDGPTTVVNIRTSPRHATGPNYVYVGRGRGSVWGNPYSHGTNTSARFLVATREEAVEKYEEWLLNQPDLLARLPELRGKVLGCWCKPLACHGDVLSRLADEGMEGGVHALAH